MYYRRTVAGILMLMLWTASHADLNARKGVCLDGTMILTEDAFGVNTYLVGNIGDSRGAFIRLHATNTTPQDVVYTTRDMLVSVGSDSTPEVFYDSHPFDGKALTLVRIANDLSSITWLSGDRVLRREKCMDSAHLATDGIGSPLTMYLRIDEIFGHVDQDELILTRRR